MLVAMLSSLYTLFPLVSLRHWFFWSHAFSAAACLATVCIISPGCALVDLALRDLSVIIDLLPFVKDALPREAIQKDADWLTFLQQKAISAVQSHRRPTPLSRSNSIQADKDAHLDIIGGKTRLIKQVDPTQPQPLPTNDGLFPPIDPADDDWVSYHTFVSYLSYNNYLRLQWALNSFLRIMTLGR
jgi:hypothetical protein